MFLVELVMQGVRGMRELTRLRFQSGFNFIAAGNESGKTSSVDTLLRLLFPSKQSALMDRLISRHVPDASRAALVAHADDNAYYRVIEDFSKRAANLSRYNPASKEFALLYKDWESIIQFMSGLCAGISEHEYARLFVLRRDQHPGGGSSASDPAAVARRSTAARPASGPGRTAEQEARLAELREALRRSEEAADADYRLQSAKIKLDEITKKLEQLEEMRGRQDDLELQLASLTGCENLPENLTELVAEHDQRQTQKMAESDELTLEIEGLNYQLEEMPNRTIWSDKLFLAGAFVAAVSIGVGLFLPSLVPADYFLIGVLFAMLLAATGWYNGSRKKAQRKLILKEIERLESELADLEKSFEQGGGTILACMRATGSSTTAELEDKVTNYRYFRSLQENLLEERDRLLGGIAPEDLHDEYEHAEKEIVGLEKAYAALAPYAIDSYSLRQDIERLESEMSDGAMHDFSLGAGEMIEEIGFAAPRQSGQSNGDFMAVIDMASRIGGIEMNTLVPAVEAAAQRNLGAVTGGRYVRVEVGQGGDPVVHGKNNSVADFSELSHGTKDLVYFCLRTGLVEALAGKRRLPLILDDPLAGFDPARQQAACQILRTLGTKTQVVLLTSNPALKAAGDAAAELK